MKKIVLDAVKHFLFLFLVLEMIPYVINRTGDKKEILLQTVVIMFFSIAISIFNSKRQKSKDDSI